MGDPPSPASITSSPVEEIDVNGNSRADAKEDVTNDITTSYVGNETVEAERDIKQPASIPAWISSLKPDNRAQPWRAHEGIAEDRSFNEGPDAVLMEATEYPGGSLAA